MKFPTAKEIRESAKQNNKKTIKLARKNFNKYKKIYAFIVLASIFTTAISVGIGFLQNISKNSNSYPQFVLFMCITSLLMSNIGFSKLLNFIYPVFGYIGILQIVIIFFIN